jgi:ferrous iron transport protein B
MKTIALLGNPNVGKTTLYNELTGSKQYVGNWPGVTVDKKEGYFNNIKIVDLPGIYAMDTYSNEEKVAKEFLQEDDVDLILNIVDAGNLDRNLYLTTQLKQFSKPILLAINMVDVAESKGIVIDYKKLESIFNVTIIPISASKNIGLDKLKDSIENEKFKIPKDKEKFNFINDKEAYAFIEDALSKSITHLHEDKVFLSQKIDRILLNPIFAYPFFILMMILMFQFTFAWVGQPISDFMDTILNESLIPWVSELLVSSSPWFQSLIVDGIISGVGGIIVLLPIILTLFICISILEDSGYMARVAFLMDKLMRKIGLSGKAFIPMIVGFGCTVPAIMSARTLESEKDRKLTALLVPLMSCNARLPVYAVFASIFFSSHQGLVVASLYLLGILIAFIIGLLFKNTIFKKDEEPFILELPEYKKPKLKSIYKQTSDKGISFLKRAGTLIFAMSVVIWFLSNFNFGGLVENVNDSILASIGSFMAPIFTPLGFGNWQSSVSLLTGLLAKETIISSMQVIFAGDLSITLGAYFSPLSAYSFLTFVLLYTPCVSVIGVMKKEFGIKMTLFSIFYQLVLAWVVSFIVYNVGNLII